MSTRRNVQVGADLLLTKQAGLIKGKNLGLITNHSALLRSGEHLVDALAKRTDVRLRALFGPEHGFRGTAPDRKGIGNEVDSKTGIPVYSLFGKTIKPTRRMLKGIDVLLFDIQDVGARFYTYITTLTLAMEAAAENGIPFIVLDRPNPIGGALVEGPILDPRLRSFVGWLPIPVLHGMTIGELAVMINGEQWMKRRVTTDLHVVAMNGWNRTLTFDRTGIRWVDPSPSIRSQHIATVYGGSCFIEGTNVSEGRGTDHPFEQIGAPWIRNKALCGKLAALHLPGVTFLPVTFTPRSTLSVTTDSKYEGEPCQGVFVKVTDAKHFLPVKTGVSLLWALQNLYPDDFVMKPRRLDELVGNRQVRRMVLAGSPPEVIARTWQADVDGFLEKRKEYLLYP